MGQNKSSKKVANGLVAMSSAAVLAVYAAGYVRTRPAANRLAAQVYERPLVHEETAGETTSEASMPPLAANRAPVAPIPVQPAHAETKSTTVAKLDPAVSAAPAPATIADQTAKTIATPGESATTAAPASAAASQPMTSPSVATASPITPATTAADTQSQGESQASTAPAPPPPPPPPVWKDGKYTAWGTCQHGDIQATVVIEAGRIKSAEITDCQTRYSCDIIDTLPPKVLARQKNKFDRVGGATESAYAYYGAVYWALDQAAKAAK